jgi:hypothetical protein
MKKNYYTDLNTQPPEEGMEINLEKIKSGEDLRTSICIRNIPNKYKQFEMLQEIKKNHDGRYDFFYIPIDYQTNASVGYCFLNMVHPLFILDFYK